MPEKTIRQHKLGISIRDDSMELKLGESIFNLVLELPDVPTVPESIRNELSLYMPTVLKEMMWRLGKSDTSYAELHFHVEHEGWCAQVTGSGKCNCNPVLRDYNLGTWIQTLTCAVCGESTAGVVGGGVSCEEWLKWGVYRDNRIVRQYWDFSGRKYKRYICVDCLDTFHGGYTYDDFANTPDLKSLERTNPESH